MGLISRHQGAFSEGVSTRVDRIVVGVDFSEASLAAAAWAGRQLAPEAELVLVFVVAPPGSRYVVRGDPWGGDSAEGVTEASLRGALHGLATLLGIARVEIELRVGDPATELARVAESHDADLIVIGGRPRNPAPLLNELLRRTTRPVLLARDLPEGAPRTVLAALANDVAAPAVLQGAWLVAQPCDATVVALHVIDEEKRRLARATWRERSGEGTARRSLAADLRSGTEAWLERWIASADIPRERSMTLIGEGDRVKEVAAAARRTRASMVVVGSPNEPQVVATLGDRDDGRHGDGAALRGILRAAPCSLLVVPYEASVPDSPTRRRAAVDRTRRRRGAIHFSTQDFDGEPAPPPAARVGPERVA